MKNNINKNEYRTLHIFSEDISEDESWKLLDWCFQNSADEFTFGFVYADIDEEKEKVKEILELFEPFSKGMIERRLVGLYTAKKVEIYNLNNKSIELLKKIFDVGLFEDCFFGPQDINLYRNKELMFGILTHEDEGILKIKNKEMFSFNRLNIKFRNKGEWVGYA